MSIITPVTPEKKEFIRFIGAGLGTLMNCSMVSDEIYIGQDDDNETYIKDNILVGSSFCANRFSDAMDTIDDETLDKLLKYFDGIDMPIARAYNESCIPHSDLPEDLRRFAESIVNTEIQTFEDFLKL